MTEILAGSTVLTAGQVFIFARNVNDARVITETRALIEQYDIDPDHVAAIEHQPARAPRQARLVFKVYATGDDGERVPVHDDGTPWEAQSGKSWRYVTKDEERVFRSELPTWWSQAVRAVAPVPPGSE